MIIVVVKKFDIWNVEMSSIPYNVMLRKKVARLGFVSALQVQA